MPKLLTLHHKCRTNQLLVMWMSKCYRFGYKGDCYNVFWILSQSVHKISCPPTTAPDTIKMAETIIVMPCCSGKSRQPNSTIPFCYVQTKLQSFSNWGNHNIKLESVCPRYKMPEKHNGYANLPLFTSKWPLEKPIPQLQSSFE